MSAARKPLFAVCLIATSASLASAEERIPVIGMDGPEMDACGGIGRVFTLEEALAVYEEPDAYARKKGELPGSTLVWLCEATGEWQGIVYPTGEFQELGDCRVSSPVAEPRAYEGPCQHGWVAARNLNLVAG